ncbi:hypothetical protein [Methylocapsa sp. S129]|uniref:hypothetical protein n=1 Tax=Methylocapsa sp. S129 TaxID=1641869 RepID=UPI00131CB32C|nr:hypothetical protein [Methylocapsa sp. S129]
MNIFLKLCAAGLACAFIAAGTIAANANPIPADVTATTVAPSTSAIVIALNPQPLPPGRADDFDDYDFEG